MDGHSQSLIDDIIAFWFGRPGDDGFGLPREVWWEKDPAFDNEIRNRYLGHYERATGGAFDWMEETPLGALALVLILDQFSRNMFRDSAKMYASDEAARRVARQALDVGFDRKILSVRRLFFYLPFEHSERLADQDLSVSLFEELLDHADRDRNVHSARRHREIVARFGHFPHRNKILGRPSTPEEIEFLKEPNSSF